MTMPKLNGPAFEIAYHSLGPAIQLLRGGKPQAELVSAYLGQALHQLRNWSESRTETGPVGPFPTLLLSPEEAKEVYGAFDAGFRAAFPALGNLTREQMSGYALMLARETISELKRPGCFTKTRQSLYGFLKVCSDRLEEIEDRHMCAA